MISKRIMFFAILLSLSIYFGSFIVSAEAPAIEVTISSIFDSENIVIQTPVSKTYGTKFAFDGNIGDLETYDFAFWIVNGVVRMDLAVDHQFTITSVLDLKAIFSPTGEHAVVFMDANGKMLDAQFVATNDDAVDTSISLPSKPGYDITSEKWDKAITGITEDKVVILQYEKTTSTTYTLTTTNGTGAGTFAYNGIASVTPTVPEGNHFWYWHSNNKIVSYNSDYSFTMLQNRNSASRTVYGASYNISTGVTAVYSTTPLSPEPLVRISNGLSLRTSNYSYIGQFEIPTGYELVEFGLLYSPNYMRLEFSDSSVSRIQGSKYVASTKEFLISLPDTNVTARAYLVVKNIATSELSYYHSNQVFNSDSTKLATLKTNIAAISSGKTAQWPRQAASTGNNIDDFITCHGFSGYTLSHGTSLENVLYFGYNSFIPLREMKTEETVLPWNEVQPYTMANAPLFSYGVFTLGPITTTNPRGTGAMYFNPNSTSVVVNSKHLYGIQHLSSAFTYNSYGVIKVNSSGIVTRIAGAELATGVNITIASGEYLLTMFEADRFAVGGTAAFSYGQNPNFATGQIVQINYNKNLVYNNPTS